MEDNAQYLLDSKRLDVNHDCGRLVWSTPSVVLKVNLESWNVVHSLCFYTRIFF